MKICYWKFEGNLNTHVPLWAQQHMVDRHYSLNLKPWSATTLYVYAHADLAQKYSVGLQEIFVSRLFSQEENSFFLPWVCIASKRSNCRGKRAHTLQYLYMHVSEKYAILTTEPRFRLALTSVTYARVPNYCRNCGVDLSNSLTQLKFSY